MFLVDVILSGLILGGIYALIAMGLSLQYGVARIMNLAYGEFTIAASFLAYVMFTLAGVSPILALAVAMPASFALNWAIYRVLMTPLVKRAKSPGALEVDSILATFGLLFVVQGILLMIFGGSYVSYSYLAVPVQIIGSTVALNRLLAAGLAVAIALALTLFLMRTRIGTAIRAVSVNPAAAPLVGIDTTAYAAFAFGLGGALVAASGVLVSMFFTFNAAMGVVFTMKALIVVIMGGVGNIFGALIAGLILGLAESLTAAFLDGGLTLAVNFALFLAILLIRPTGLFGKAAR
ncbi:branched-chain amino acid ABC transporter permease [Phreatobacter oligotrophus]|jgi:branched-chain amino acid transport system permease protein|uniref:Branched-chain amino acid transport system permease protein n=1 Tax=Phreatobacter oligotrophus TaxID=1122261 RepID=A0A2T4ZGF8_9HYPH|nr:branched-chain amino acid ABC transporter permease [Phreatobacter oligotrophus]PTM61000.1 branched-chain amino acid transport system permease protein [Phreatobacter oligotrophus]